MKYCPVCLKEYLADATHCEADGQALEKKGIASVASASPGTTSLTEWIRRQAPLPIETAVNFICAICDIVEQATGRPPDFFDPRRLPLTKDSQPDRAALLIELRRPAATDKANLDEVAAYLSPEAAPQQPTDATSAVYSLGAILYEMLTGQPPFAAASVAAIAIKQILESPRPPRQLREEISESLQRVMLRALEKDKSSRPASLSQFRQELQAALQQEPAKFETFVDMPAVAMPPLQAVTEALDEMVGNAAPQQSDNDFDASTRTLSESPTVASDRSSAPALPMPTVAASAPPPQLAAPPSQAASPQVYGSYSAPVSYPMPASYPAASSKSSKKIYVIAASLVLLAIAAIAIMFLSKSASPPLPASTNTAPPPMANRNTSTTTTPSDVPPPMMNRNGSPAPPVNRNTAPPPVAVSKQNPLIVVVLIGVVVLGATATVIFVFLLRRKAQPAAPATRGNPPLASYDNLLVNSLPQPQAQSPPKPLPQMQPSSAQPLPRCSRCQAITSPGEQFCLQCHEAIARELAYKRFLQGTENDSISERTPLPQPSPQPIVKSEADPEQTQKRVRGDSAPPKERIKVCPACQTEFATTIKFCVHDGTVLEERMKTIPPRKDPSFYDLQTLDKRKRCPQCHIEYPETKKFCHKDGSRLVLIPPGDAPEKAIEAIEPFKIAQYECFARLGEGGMGLVYKARDVDLQRLAAVKVLLPKTKNLDEAARLFRREAQLASSINHPNIVTIYSCGETNVKLLYMAMEFIEGRSLADILKAKGATAQPLPLPKVLHITRSIADALDAAHEHGIVHRDLKPQNVMICPRLNRPDIVKVVDFGIARSLVNQNTHETLSGSIVGTPMYMSPEQARGELDIDERSDVFSLAIMVYQMLSGKLPFAGEEKSTLQVLSRRAHLQDAPPPLRMIRADLNLPEALDSVLQRALEPDRNRRTRSAMQFSEQFEQAVRMAIP